jgi:Transcription factor WhiB
MQDALGRLLRHSFAGPGEQVLPQAAVHQLVARIGPDWIRYAACQNCDGDAWFPDERTKPNPLVEKVCADCPVQTTCVATAVLGDEEGIWGGTRRGQRLHARARLFNHDPLDQVLTDLLASPMPVTEYAVTDPHQTTDQRDPCVQPEQPNDDDDQAEVVTSAGEWREAS